MHLGMGFHLQACQPAMYDERDLLNLLKWFPMEMHGTGPNWVVGGGVAVELLVQAEEVNGRVVHPQFPCERREHKDLDVYVFNASPARFRLEHPHELYRTWCFGRPERCDYQSDEVGNGFFIELLSGAFFGCPPPTVEDTVWIRVGKRRVWTLSPEYIIATRCFSTGSIREDTDDVDVTNLVRRLSLQPDRLISIVRQGLFHFLSPEEVMNAIDIRESPVTEYRMQDAIHAELERRFGDDYDLIPYEGRRSLLLFKKDELPMEKLKERIDDMMHAVFGLAYKDRVAAVCLSEAGRFPLGVYEPLLENACRHRPLRTAIDWLATIRRFEREASRTGHPMEGAAGFLTNRFMRTAFLNIYLAKLSWAGETLSHIPKGDRYQSAGILHKLFTFFGEFDWKKMVNQ